MSIVIILACATIATVLNALFTWRTATTAAEDSLKLQALGIAASIEASLQQSTIRTNSILSDIITEGGWEGIAYLSLHAEDGTIVLHSNKNLTGKRVQDQQLMSAVSTGKPAYHYLRLATDERVFVMDIPLHIRTGSYYLRLALHTYPAESPVRQARLSLATAGGVVMVLWLIGFFLLRLQRREERLRTAMIEREQFAVLGEMASVLAHEIRNPLGSIKGFAQYLREQRSTGAPPERMDTSLNVIVTEAERLEILTNDLLVYARPEELHADEFELCAFISETIASHMPKTGAHVSVTCSPDILVCTDRSKLRQILLNLVENGCDAAGPEGSVVVSVRSSRATIGIEVSDTGPGMASDIAARAFEPFFTTKVRGTGLGLAIVKRLVEILRGSITLTTAPNEGTRFIIVLPLSLKDVI